MAAGLLFALLAALSWRVYAGQPAPLAVALVWSAAVAGGYRWAERKDRFHAYRRAFFASLAFFFLLQMHLPARGDAAEPYCHLALAGNFIQTSWNQWLAIAGGTWGAYGALSLGILWLLVVLACGGAFCSWVCFFGGVDDTLAGLRKPLFRIPNASRVRVFQLALLLLVAWVSFGHAEPEFCRILCPFKLTGEIATTHGEHPLGSWIISFIIVGGVLLVGLPLATGQRTFCSGICPFGAIPPLFAKLNPYRVAARRETCTECGTCGKVCPSFAIDSGKEGFRVNRYCTTCLRCVDACPAGAMQAGLFGRKPSILLPLVPVALGGALSVFYVPLGLLALARLLGWHP